MHFNKIKLLSFILVAVSILTSCNDDTNNTKVILSANADFVSLTLSNDTFPNLSKTIFRVDSLNGFYSITNVDSMDYRTSLTKVKVKFKFVSSSKTTLSYIDNKIFYDTTLVGNEVLNLTFNGMSLVNYSSDGQKNKVYSFNFLIHKVNPNLYQWSQSKNKINTINCTNQKAVYFKNTIYYLFNDGVNSYLQTSSTDSPNDKFSEKTTISGLPSTVSFKDLTVFNDKLYLTQNSDELFVSSDGITWNKSTYGKDNFSFKSLLYNFKNQLWAVIFSNDNKYHLANSNDGITWITRGVVPDDYPVSDFSALSYKSRNGSDKAIVIGGLDKNGIQLNTNWNTDDGYKLLNFGSNNGMLDSLDLGASIINYDNKLYLIGAVKNSKIRDNHFYYFSINEGLTWQKPNKNTNQISELEIRDIVNSIDQDTTIIATYGVRKHQSIIVNKNNRIFIIGGKGKDSFYDDVWTGKLNKLYVNKVW
jgi:hypothetical protein